MIVKPVQLGSFIVTLRDTFEKKSDLLGESSNIYSNLTKAQCTDSQLDEYLRILNQLSKQLENCISKDNYEKSLKICNSLHATGAGFGYAILSTTAANTIKSLNASCSAKESSTEIRKLVRLVARMRSRKDTITDTLVA